MTTREDLHRLIDWLPDSELPTIERYLRERHDPLRRALAEAPEDDELETDEERAAVAEAYQDVAASRIVPHAEARRRLLGRS